MLIATLLGIIIAIVVGINLIPMIMGTLEEATEDAEDVPAAVSAMLDILPIVFVAVMIMGAVAWIGGSGFSFGSSKKSKSKDYQFSGGSYSGRELLDSIKKEEDPEKKKEEEVLEIPERSIYGRYNTHETLKAPGIPKAPSSSSKPSRKPPWAK